MRNEPEKDEAWALPQEMSPQLEGHRWSLFFRLARKRADYFSDIEDPLLMPEIDVFPTRRASALRRASGALLTRPENLFSLAEQPTRLNLVMEEAPTLLLPSVVTLPARIEATPITVKLLAPIEERTDLVFSPGKLARRLRKCALALFPKSLSTGWLWSMAHRVRCARSK